jgi:M6 family metalloprotease-like protein
MYIFVVFLFSCCVQLLNAQTCRLANFDSHSDVAIGFPRISNRANVNGILNVTVLFVDFIDAPAYMSPNEAFQIVSPGSEDFYKAVSYGKLNMKLLPYFKWLRMCKRSHEYSMSPSISFNAHKAYISEAVNLAANSVDFSTSEIIVVITNPSATSIAYGPAFCPNSGYGINVKGKIFENAVSSGRDLQYWKSFWLNHEMGHTFGLPDLYAFSGNQFRYTGDWSLMGNINGVAREFFGWERWLLGWLLDSQVLCVSEKGTSNVQLTPIEKAGGLKIAVIPRSESTAVVVESRRALGYDSGIKMPGVLVYVVVTSVGTGNGPIRVLPLNDDDQSKLAAPLIVGRSLTYNGVTVTYVSTDTEKDSITIQS